MPSATFLAASFSFMERSSSTTVSLFPGSFLTLLSVDRLEHLSYQLCLGTRCYRENIAVEVDYAPLVCGFWEYFSHSLQHTKTLVTNHRFNSI